MNKKPEGYLTLAERGVNLSSDPAINEKKIAQRPVSDAGFHKTAKVIAALNGYKVYPTQKMLLDIEKMNVAEEQIGEIQYTGPRTASGAIDLGALTSHLSLVDKEPEGKVTFDIGRDRVISNHSSLNPKFK